MNGAVVRFCPNCAFKYVDRRLPDLCEGCGISLKAQQKGTKKKKRPTRPKSRIKSTKKREKMERLRKRDGDRCWLCGEKIEFGLHSMHEMGWSLDHVVPTTMGGRNFDMNLRLAHRKCNNEREWRFPETIPKEGRIDTRRLRERRS